MKKLSFLIIAAVLLILQESCDILEPCGLKHYVESSSCRIPMSFTADTLSMRALAKSYFDLVEGDTIVVVGYLNQYHYLEYVPSCCYHGDNNIDIWRNKYLCDNPSETDTSYCYRDYMSGDYMKDGGIIYFFERLHLYIIPNDTLWAYPNNSKVIVQGVFHLEYWGRDYSEECEELCVLEPIKYSLEDEK